MALKIITAAPGTFEVELKDEDRRRLQLHLEDGSLDVARLALRDLRPEAERALKGVKIFIEKPDADAATPVDDPHYAGNFVLGLEAPQNLLWNIAPALSRLWQSGDLTSQQLTERKTLRITFVPEPWDFAPALPKNFSLTFKNLAVEVPSPP